MKNDELAEIRELFLEECSENLDVLENGLLEMAEGGVERETVDSVFRAAHSIKGGGATFGFEALSELTHHMETYLDTLRNGAESDPAAIQTMLGGVDALREMLLSTDAEAHSAYPGLDELKGALRELSGSTPAATSGSAESTAPGATTNWSIEFTPNPDMATRGNDPYLILRELSTLGTSTVTPNLGQLPDLADYDAMRLYVSFSIDLVSDCSEQDIREIFEWVEFDCTLSIDAKPDAAETPEVDKPQTESAKSPQKARNSAGSGDGSMRIATEKIDRILDLVGELVITQSMLSGAAEGGANSEQFEQSIEQLERNIRELQESVMRVRMLPIAFAFGRLPRIVHDLSARLDKQVDLVVEGENTELDKTVLDHILDPLVHLTRNAIDHGLETPQERLEANKPEVGQLKISAYHQSGAIIIEIQDDGKGINTEKVLRLAQERGLVAQDAQLSESEIAQLIFAPGFSTAEAVTDVSGRGVGMDVVRRNIVELGGKVEVTSEAGKGSRVTIQLPLTLAILDGQLVQVADQVFVIPIINIVETLELRDIRISQVPDLGPVAEFRDRCVPLVYLKDHLLAHTQEDPIEERLVLIVEAHGRTVGLVIGTVLGQQQVVIKTLEDNFRKIEGVSGASIMSDGSVALILDVAAFASTQPNHQAA